jgi:predicted nucleic acid-binding protein
MVIPGQVAEEIHQGPDSDAVKNWLSGAVGEKHIVEAPQPPPVVANWDLGAGESHVLSFALANRGYEAVLDDLASRKCAKTLAIPTLGTLGVLLLVKKRGLIAAVSPIADELLEAGFHVLCTHRARGIPHPNYY